MADTTYQKAIAELWGYFDEHGAYEDCKAPSEQRDTDGNCFLSDAHFAREHENLNPTKTDIELAVEWLVNEAEMRNIDDDEPYNPEHPNEDEEGRGYVNFLIRTLEAEEANG